MAQEDLTSCALSDSNSGIDRDMDGDRDEHTERPVFIVVMGVSGTGKSTLGSALAQALRMPYVEGDDLHPRANVAKMAAGVPLDDADREPWLELVRATAEGKVVELQAEVEGKEGEGEGENEEEGKGRRKCYGVVISCSALKAYYRDILRGKLKPASSTAPLPLPLPAVVAGLGERVEAQGPHPQPNTIPTHLAPAHPAHLPTYFVFISGARAVLLDRMEKRPGHFMKATMLDSQLRTLEDPTGEEGVVVVSLDDSTEEQVRSALEGLGKVAGEGFREYVRELDALN